MWPLQLGQNERSLAAIDIVKMHSENRCGLGGQ